MAHSAATAGSGTHGDGSACAEKSTGMTKDCAGPAGPLTQTPVCRLRPSATTGEPRRQGDAKRTVRHPLGRQARSAAATRTPSPTSEARGIASRASTPPRAARIGAAASAPAEPRVRTAQVGPSKRKAAEATSTGARGTAGWAGTTPPCAAWNGVSTWAAPPARQVPDAADALGAQGQDAGWGGQVAVAGRATVAGAADWGYGGAAWWGQYPYCGNMHDTYGARMLAPQPSPDADHAWKSWMLQRGCTRWDGSPWVGWGHSWQGAQGSASQAC